MDPFTAMLAIKATAAGIQTGMSALGLSKEKSLAADNLRKSNEFVEQAKKRLSVNPFKKLGIGVDQSRKRLNQIQEVLAQQNLGQADQRTASADAARQAQVGLRAYDQINQDLAKQQQMAELRIAQEESGIAGDIANIELAQAKQAAENARQSKRLQNQYTQGMVKGLADLAGTFATGLTDPQVMARREANRAFRGLRKATDDMPVEYLGKVAGQLGQYDVNDPSAFLSGLDVANPDLKLLMENTEFAKGLQDLYAGGTPTGKQLKEFLTTNLDAKQLASLGSIDASTSPVGFTPIELEEKSIQAGLTPGSVTETILQEQLRPATMGGLNNINPTVSSGLSQMLYGADRDRALLQQQNMMMPDPTYGIPSYLFNPNEDELDPALQGLYFSPMFSNNIPTVTP